MAVEAIRFDQGRLRAVCLAPVLALGLWVSAPAIAGTDIADRRSAAFCKDDKELVRQLLRLRDKHAPKTEVLAVIEELEPKRRTYREMVLMTVTEMIYTDDRSRGQIMESFATLCWDASVRSLGEDQLKPLSDPEIGFCLSATRILDFAYVLKSGGVPKARMEAALKEKFQEKGEYRGLFLLELLRLAYDSGASNEAAVRAMPAICRILVEQARRLK